jgi:hypothetical protein
MQPKYNHRNCQSLFGYAEKVHRRFHWTCQLCGCGGEPIDFNLWRQLTVEHVIGESQGGYVKDLRMAVANRFPMLAPHEQEQIVLAIDEMNTVTACSFCNSTTSRDHNEKSMVQLLAAEGDPEQVVGQIHSVLAAILEKKRGTVQWKLASIREAFDRLIGTSP